MEQLSEVSQAHFEDLMHNLMCLDKYLYLVFNRDSILGIYKIDFHLKSIESPPYLFIPFKKEPQYYSFQQDDFGIIISKEHLKDFYMKEPVNTFYT